jgi:hypothetical protein
MHKDEPVEVRSTYEGEWTTGFSVEEERPSGYLLRRDSDDTVLPAEVATDDVRAVDTPE